jgi:hypothetical protein
MNDRNAADNHGQPQLTSVQLSSPPLLGVRGQLTSARLRIGHGRKLDTLHHLTGAPKSRRYPVQGQVQEPSRFLTSGIESAMAPGARTGSAMRPGRKSGVGRPTLGEVVPIGSPCEQRRTCWGSERLHFAPGPRPFLPVVPFACHIGQSIPVPSGQPRSRPSDRQAGRPRRTSKNAFRECA